MMVDNLSCDKRAVVQFGLLKYEPPSSFRVANEKILPQINLMVTGKLSASVVDFIFDHFIQELIMLKLKNIV